MVYRLVIVEHISGLLCQHNLVNGHLQTIQNSTTNRVATFQRLQFHVLSLRLDPTRSYCNTTVADAMRRENVGMGSDGNSDEEGHVAAGGH